VVGDMTLRYENVAFVGDPGQTMCIYTAEAGSASEAALRLLASWTAEARTEARPEPEANMRSKRDHHR
jgi:hypothetical protein